MIMNAAEAVSSLWNRVTCGQTYLKVCWPLLALFHVWCARIVLVYGGVVLYDDWTSDVGAFLFILGLVTLFPLVAVALLAWGIREIIVGVRAQRTALVVAGSLGIVLTLVGAACGLWFPFAADHRIPVGLRPAAVCATAVVDLTLAAIAVRLCR